MISGGTIREAWARAATHVADCPQLRFLVVEIADATLPTDHELRAWDVVAERDGFERPSSVADVLMPKPVVVSAGNDAEALEKGWKLLGRARRSGIRFSGWRDTYFERLTGTFTGRDLRPVTIKPNRISEVIQKLRGWNRNVSAALYAHTDRDRDTLRPRGAPCLQYVQFEPIAGGTVNLLALYRSHDYAQKALGNFVGLSRLLTFVCAQSGKNVGALTVFSVHPTAGSPKGKLKSYADAIVRSV